jgi:hypothetical protein
VTLLAYDSPPNFLSFFARPFGGVELEIAITLEEIGCGLVIFFSPSAVWNSIPLSEFYGKNSYLLSLAFFVSAMFSVIGLTLFRYKKRVCSPLRFTGSVMSWIIWSGLSAQTFQLIGFDLIHLVFYIVSALASIRTSAGAWVRWWEPPFGVA